MRSGDECRAGLGDLGGHLGDRGERLAQRRRDGAGGDTRLDFVGEAKQSEALGDALRRDRELLGDLTLIEPAGAHRPVEATSLVDRVQVLALEVLHHGERLGLSGFGLAHDRGYLHEPDGRGGREAPVAGDDAEGLALAGGRDQQRLQDAVAADRLDELRLALVVDGGAGVETLLDVDRRERETAGSAVCVGHDDLLVLGSARCGADPLPLARRRRARMGSGRLPHREPPPPW